MGASLPLQRLTLHQLSGVNNSEWPLDSRGAQVSHLSVHERVESTNAAKTSTLLQVTTPRSLGDLVNAAVAPRNQATPELAANHGLPHGPNSHGAGSTGGEVPGQIRLSHYDVNNAVKTLHQLQVTHI